MVRNRQRAARENSFRPLIYSRISRIALIPSDLSFSIVLFVTRFTARATIFNVAILPCNIASLSLSPKISIHFCPAGVFASIIPVSTSTFRCVSGFSSRGLINKGSSFSKLSVGLNTLESSFFKGNRSFLPNVNCPLTLSHFLFWLHLVQEGSKFFQSYASQ